MTGLVSFSIGTLAFDPRSGELKTRAGTRRLEPKAAGVLRVLCEHEGSVVTRLELLERCWRADEGSDEALTQVIAQIRRAMDELGEPGLVETLAKRGYRLNTAAIPPATEAPPSNDRRALRLLISSFVLAGIVLIMLLISNPHGPRHLVRHALGLGPPTATHPGD